MSMGKVAGVFSLFPRRAAMEARAGVGLNAGRSATSATQSRPADQLAAVIRAAVASVAT